jgi:hypothetical protein
VATKTDETFKRVPYVPLSLKSIRRPSDAWSNRVFYYGSAPRWQLCDGFFTSVFLCHTQRIFTTSTSTCIRRSFLKRFELLWYLPFVYGLDFILTYSGYVLGSLEQRSTGLTAQLSLAGPACNVFGRDISNLTVQVTYESETRYVLLNATPLLALN